jgi:NADPH:quinone reductase-like Zn-dependent oxidoreductase
MRENIQMKAVICTELGQPEVMQLKEVAKPVPRENEVLIKIYTSIVTVIDLNARRPIMNISPSRIRERRLGYYLAGEVEEIGTNVKRFKKGDRVFGGDVWSKGAYAEYKCTPAKKVRLLKPSTMTFEEAVAIPYGGGTALPFLREAGKIRRGHKVLIIGASGSIGTFAVQLARYFGAEVTGVCSTTGIDLVRSMGANRVIDYTQEDFTKNGRTYDIIFDTPAKYSYSDCKGSLTKNGRYLTTVPWPKDLLQMLWTSIASRKKAIFRPMGLRFASQKARDLAFLQDLSEKEKIKPAIDRVYPLEQIVEAHRYVENGHKKGNVIITVAHDNEA